MMMPPTPRTVSPTAGWQAAVTSWIALIVTESGHVALGHCVAEATPAVHSSAATARKRVNVLLMSDPLVAGGRYECETRSGGLAGAAGRGLLRHASWGSRAAAKLRPHMGDDLGLTRRMIQNKPDKSKEFQRFGLVSGSLTHQRTSAKIAQTSMGEREVSKGRT